MMNVLGLKLSRESSVSSCFINKTKYQTSVLARFFFIRTSARESWKVFSLAESRVGLKWKWLFPFFQKWENSFFLWKFYCFDAYFRENIRKTNTLCENPNSANFTSFMVFNSFFLLFVHHTSTVCMDTAKPEVVLIREYWMIYRGPGFLGSYNSAPRPPFLPLPVSKCSLYLSLPVLRRSSLVTREVGGYEEAGEPNHETSRKAVPL